MSDLVDIWLVGVSVRNSKLSSASDLEIWAWQSEDRVHQKFCHFIVTTCHFALNGTKVAQYDI